MIHRIASDRLKYLTEVFKVVAVTGPRQSGKTTLVKRLFLNRPYANLENPETLDFATTDPKGFLKQFPNGAVLDEVQRAPQLFSYIQGIADNSTQKGQFILTGSNNFLLNEKISQSLAGRVGFLNILPFSLEEMGSTYNFTSENEYILNGFYPPVHDQQIPAHEWIPNYIRTYIDRDVRQIKNITNLLVFERFLRLLAGQTGQELNLTSLSVEVGVDVKTIQSWIGILESSYIIFLLKPFYKNFNKTIVKRPKVYFYDTAIVCNLLRITKLEHLETHPLRGALFECMVVSEMYKQNLHRGKDLNYYYWRDKTGREIDVLIDEVNTTIPIEIKSGKTVQKEYFKSINYWQKLTNQKKSYVIYSGEELQKRSDGSQVIPWRQTPLFLEELL